MFRTRAFQVMADSRNDGVDGGDSNNYAIYCDAKVKATQQRNDTCAILGTSASFSQKSSSFKQMACHFLFLKKLVSAVMLNNVYTITIHILIRLKICKVISKHFKVACRCMYMNINLSVIRSICCAI